MTFLTHFHVVYSFLKEGKHMNQNTERQRKKYMDHPPEEMTSEDIRHMSEDTLLNMDYFFQTHCYLTYVWRTYVSFYCSENRNFL